MGTKKIYSFHYAKTSDLAVLLGKTINEGDKITKADLAGLTWQKVATSSGFDKLDFTKKAFEEEQYSDVVVDKFTQAGFADPKGSVEVIYNPKSTAVKHKAILQNGFGTLVAGGASTDITAVASKTAITVTDSTGFSVGDLIKIGSDYHGLIKAIAGNDLTLSNPIPAVVGDVVELSDYWKVKELESPEKSFLVLIKSNFGYKVCTFCRFNIGLKVAEKALFKMDFSFMGDYIIPGDFTGFAPTILQDDNLTKGVTTAFSGLTFNEEKACSLAFEFELKRDGKRMKCVGTEMRTGNGGMDNSEYTTELQIKQYSKTLETLYEDNTQFPILAQRGELVVYLPAARISEFNDLSEDDGLQIVDQKVLCNTDSTKDIKIVLG